MSRMSAVTLLDSVRAGACVADGMREDEDDEALEMDGRASARGGTSPETGRRGSGAADAASSLPLASLSTVAGGRASRDALLGGTSPRGAPFEAGAGDAALTGLSPAADLAGVPSRLMGVEDRPGDELAELGPFEGAPPAVRFSRSSSIDFSLSGIGPTSFHV